MTSKRVPIAAARRLAKEYNLSRVMMLTMGEDGTAHLVTYGKTKEQCRLSAQDGERLKKFMGWTK